VFVEAGGAGVVDVAGNEYVDLCLGDTGAMTGHSPPPTVKAASERLARGSTTMLPSPDAADVGTELARRFGLRHWQLSLSATDADRVVVRLAPAGGGAAQNLARAH